MVDHLRNCHLFFIDAVDGPALQALQNSLEGLDEIEQSDLQSRLFRFIDELLDLPAARIEPESLHGVDDTEVSEEITRIWAPQPWPDPARSELGTGAHPVISRDGRSLALLGSSSRLVEIGEQDELSIRSLPVRAYRRESFLNPARYGLIQVGNTNQWSLWQVGEPVETATRLEDVVRHRNVVDERHRIAEHARVRNRREVDDNVECPVPGIAEDVPAH